MGDVFYFAYGANMSGEVLARRGVAPLGAEPAVVRGYRHAFSHEGLLPTEPAFANLEADAGGESHGVLYRLAADGLARLDRVEGAEYLHVDVDALGARSGVVRARAYVNPHPVPGLVPSRRYLRTLIAGAREHALPDVWIQRLEAQPSRHWLLVSDLSNLFVGVAEALRRRGLRPERARMRRRGHAGRSTETP